MNHPLLNMLGIARRARKLSIGFDAAAEAVRTGRSRLIVAAADLSAKTEKEIRYLIGRRSLDDDGHGHRAGGSAANSSAAGKSTADRPAVNRSGAGLFTAGRLTAGRSGNGQAGGGSSAANQSGIGQPSANQPSANGSTRVVRIPFDMSIMSKAIGTKAGILSVDDDGLAGAVLSRCPVTGEDDAV